MNGSTNTSIQLSSRVARSEAIEFTRIEDTVIMMDVDEARYYELDPVGTRIWTLIESGPRVAEMCEALAAEYEVAPAVCGEDVSAFLDRLLRLAVIRIREGDNEIANDGSPGVAAALSGPARPEPPAGIAVPRRGSEPQAKLAWSTPIIRTMSIARTESGEEEQTIEVINQWVSYHPEEPYS